MVLLPTNVETQVLGRKNQTHSIPRKSINAYGHRKPLVTRSFASWRHSGSHWAPCTPRTLTMSTNHSSNPAALWSMTQANVTTALVRFEATNTTIPHRCEGCRRCCRNHTRRQSWPPPSSSQGKIVSYDGDVIIGSQCQRGLLLNNSSNEELSFSLKRGGFCLFINICASYGMVHVTKEINVDAIKTRELPHNVSQFVVFRVSRVWFGSTCPKQIINLEVSVYLAQ